MHQGKAPVRILLVDDYEPFRRYFCSVFEQRAEFQVIGEAADGLEAIQKIRDLQPDLILLDVGLPRINGLEVAPEACRLAPLAKILFVSQEFSFDIVEAALTSGASGYVHKVHVQRDLVPAVESVLRGYYFVSGVMKGAFGDATRKKAARHELRFCSDDAGCIQSLADFTESSLKAGMAAIVIASEPYRAAVLHALSAKKWDINRAIGDGILRPLDVTEKLSESMLSETLEPSGFFDTAGDLIDEVAKAVQREQAPRVGVCRECPPGLFEDGNVKRALRLEQLWGLVAHVSALDLLCVYSSAHIKKHPGLFEAIRAEHSSYFG
jgi:DNA-binding NarL/FixJ family response regulator